MTTKNAARKDFDLIAIGGSAGSLTVVQTILKKLPAGFRIPIVIVVHLPADNQGLLIQVLKGWTPNRVREPDDKAPIEARTIYAAPSGYHLMVEKEKIFCVNLDDPVQYSMPSIDVFFSSASDVFGAGLLAVILSGANEDGAEGLCHIVQSGGVGIVQDPATAQSSLMPLAALKRSPLSLIFSPEEIADFLSQL